MRSEKENKAMSTTEMWIHGNQIVIEDWFSKWLAQELYVKQDNDGQLFQVSTPNAQVEYLFHIPIPTPSIDGKRPLLNKIFIDYEVGQPPESGNSMFCIVKITELHIYNGKEWLNNGQAIWKDSGLSSEKDKKEWDISKYITPKPTIVKNLGVTIRVIFTDPSSGGKARGIKFYSAGAEFQKP